MAKPVTPTFFSWDTLPKIPVFSIEISGEYEYGKTHMSATWPAPALADTELKAWNVLQKLGTKGWWKQVKKFDDFRQVVNQAIRDPKIKTVVIDSGSDLRELAEKEWSEEHGGKKPIYIKPTGQVVPVLYGEVYQKIDLEVKKILEAGKYFVATSRLKDEYIDDVATGRRIRDGYKKFPWNLSICIELVKGIRDEKGKVHFANRILGKVHKNNFWGIDPKTWRNFSKPYLFDCSFDGVCRELLKPWGKGIPVGQETKQILKEAAEYFAGPVEKKFETGLEP